MDTKLTRLELPFNDHIVIGAQATFVDSVTIDGRTYVDPPRTTGLNCGNNPEYADTLEAALGSALMQAVAMNETLTSELTSVNTNLATVSGERDALQDQVEGLQGQLALTVANWTAVATDLQSQLDIARAAVTNLTADLEAARAPAETPA